MMPTLLVVGLSAVVLAAAGTNYEELCYEVSYGANFSNSAVLRPMARFPEFHAKVMYGYCGGAAYDSPLPFGASGNEASLFGGSQFSSASGCPKTTECVTPPYDNCQGRGYLNAGSLFYAYALPKAHSSNTGYETPETASFFFIQDDANLVWLVFTFDKPNSKRLPGGRMNMDIISSDLGGRGVGIAQMDDFKEVQVDAGDWNACSDEARDCYAWDTSTGRGTFAWKWLDCCTDGMVMGPFPADDFEMVWEFRKMAGLDGVQFGTYNSDWNSLDLTQIPFEEAKKPIRIKGYTCTDYCSRFTPDGCGKCSAQTFGAEEVPLCVMCKKDSNSTGVCVDFRAQGCQQIKPSCIDEETGEELDDDDGYIFTEAPTAFPTRNPTAPTYQPTLHPTLSPTLEGETMYPTLYPTQKPTRTPTFQPTKRPSKSPTTKRPTNNPTTSNPTKNPTTANPTKNPTTANPTVNPTINPTTANPTVNPTTSNPTTANPTTANPTTINPTANPTTANPTTANPTANPTTSNPTTANPTTANPTVNPTTNPTTVNPTVNPTTSNPTTANPTTANPTTVNPTTINPTANPTTANPTTSNPTTSNPTTVNPTTNPTANPTANPTTANPTASPTFYPKTECNLFEETYFECQSCDECFDYFPSPRDCNDFPSQFSFESACEQWKANNFDNDCFRSTQPSGQEGEPVTFSLPGGSEGTMLGVMMSICGNARINVIGPVAYTTVGGSVPVSSNYEDNFDNRQLLEGSEATSSYISPGAAIYGLFDHGMSTGYNLETTTRRLQHFEETADRDVFLTEIGCSVDLDDLFIQGGLDVMLVERVLAQKCDLDGEFPEEGSPRRGIVDECGGHVMGQEALTVSEGDTRLGYHFHLWLSCMYSPVGQEHSPQVGIVIDGKFLYGKHEANPDLPTLDACGGHFGVTPESEGQSVYHYHLQDVPPYTVGCFGPDENGLEVSLTTCRSMYPECNGRKVSLNVGAGDEPVLYQPWCPCFDQEGLNYVSNAKATDDGSSASEDSSENDLLYIIIALLVILLLLLCLLRCLWLNRKKLCKKKGLADDSEEGQLLEEALYYRPPDEIAFELDNSKAELDTLEQDLLVQELIGRLGAGGRLSPQEQATLAAFDQNDPERRELLAMRQAKVELGVLEAAELEAELESKQLEAEELKRAQLAGQALDDEQARLLEDWENSGRLLAIRSDEERAKAQRKLAQLRNERNKKKAAAEQIVSDWQAAQSGEALLCEQERVRMQKKLDDMRLARRKLARELVEVENLEARIDVLEAEAQLKALQQKKLAGGALSRDEMLRLGEWEEARSRLDEEAALDMLEESGDMAANLQLLQQALNVPADRRTARQQDMRAELKRLVDGTLGDISVQQKLVQVSELVKKRSEGGKLKSKEKRQLAEWSDIVESAAAANLSQQILLARDLLSKRASGKGRLSPKEQDVLVRLEQMCAALLDQRDLGLDKQLCELQDLVQRRNGGRQLSQDQQQQLGDWQGVLASAFNAALSQQVLNAQQLLQRRRAGQALAPREHDMLAKLEELAGHTMASGADIEQQLLQVQRLAVKRQRGQRLSAEEQALLSQWEGILAAAAGANLSEALLEVEVLDKRQRQGQRLHRKQANQLAELEELALQQGTGQPLQQQLLQVRELLAERANGRALSAGDNQLLADWQHVLAEVSGGGYAGHTAALQDLLRKCAAKEQRLTTSEKAQLATLEALAAFALGSDGSVEQQLLQVQQLQAKRAAHQPLTEADKRFLGIWEGVVEGAVAGASALTAQDLLAKQLLQKRRRGEVLGEEQQRVLRDWHAQRGAQNGVSSQERERQLVRLRRLRQDKAAGLRKQEQLLEGWERNFIEMSEQGARDREAQAVKLAAMRAARQKAVQARVQVAREDEQQRALEMEELKGAQQAGHALEKDQARILAEWEARRGAIRVRDAQARLDAQRRLEAKRKQRRQQEQDTASFYLELAEAQTRAFDVTSSERERRSDRLDALRKARRAKRNEVKEKQAELKEAKREQNVCIMVADEQRSMHGNGSGNGSSKNGSRYKASNLVRVPTIALLNKAKDEGATNQHQIRMQLGAEKERQAALLTSRKNQRTNRTAVFPARENNIEGILATNRNALEKVRDAEDKERDRLAKKLEQARKKKKSRTPRSNIIEEEQASVPPRERLVEKKRQQAIAEAAAKRKLAERGAVENLKDALANPSNKNFEQNVSIALDKCNSLNPKIQGAKETMLQAQNILLQLERVRKLKSMIQNLNNLTIAVIKSYNSPPPGVHEVLQAVFLLLGNSTKEVSDWMQCKALLSKTGKKSFKTRVHKMNISSLTPSQLGPASRKLELIDDLDEIEKASECAAVLYAWASGTIDEAQQLKRNLGDGAPVSRPAHETLLRGDSLYALERAESRLPQRQKLLPLRPNKMLEQQVDLMGRGSAMMPMH